MRVLELGSYVIPAYAGMILAEQGHEVVKWVGERPDPVQELRRGDELWAWLNDGKTLVPRHASQVAEHLSDVDVVLDNVRASTWASWGVDCDRLASDAGVTWASMRADVGERSFDLVAQARAWGDSLGLIPAYLGDTAGGLWLAFKALAVHRPGGAGHHVVTQAAALAKLVEGELAVPGGDRSHGTPWDEPGTYGPDLQGSARVEYRGQTLVEPLRDDEWRRRHLRHERGRFII